MNGKYGIPITVGARVYHYGDPWWVNQVEDDGRVFLCEKRPGARESFGIVVNAADLMVGCSCPACMAAPLRSPHISGCGVHNDPAEQCDCRKSTKGESYE